MTNKTLEEKAKEYADSLIKNAHGYIEEWTHKELQQAYLTGYNQCKADTQEVLGKANRFIDSIQFVLGHPLCELSKQHRDIIETSIKGIRYLTRSSN